MLDSMDWYSSPAHRLELSAVMPLILQVRNEWRDPYNGYSNSRADGEAGGLKQKQVIRIALNKYTL